MAHILRIFFFFAVVCKCFCFDAQNRPPSLKAENSCQAASVQLFVNRSVDDVKSDAIFYCLLLLCINTLPTSHISNGSSQQQQKFQPKAELFRHTHTNAFNIGSDILCFFLFLCFLVQFEKQIEQNNSPKKMQTAK